MFCYFSVIITTRQLVRWFSYSLMSRGEAMTVYEALSLMIAFATLIVLILSFNRK